MKEKGKKLKQAKRTIFKPNPGFTQGRAFRKAAAVTSDTVSVSNSSNCLLNQPESTVLKTKYAMSNYVAT